MSQITIENYQDLDFKEMTNLVVSSFKSKFCHRQKLTPDDMKDILSLTWDIKAGDTGYLHYVAKEKGKVVGVILIQYGEKQKNQRKIPFFNLFHRYGFLNMMLLTYKLSFLEIHKPQGCYIEHIAVEESMRGKGIGKMLLSHGEEKLKNMGFSSISLAVAKDNPAKDLYDRMKFNEISHRNNPFKGYFIGVRHWIFMRKELE